MHEKLKDLGNVGSRTDVARISTEVEQTRDVNRILALLQSLFVHCEGGHQDFRTCTDITPIRIVGGYFVGGALPDISGYFIHFSPHLLFWRCQHFPVYNRILHQFGSHIVVFSSRSKSASEPHSRSACNNVHFNLSLLTHSVAKKPAMVGQACCRSVGCGIIRLRRVESKLHRLGC